MRHSQYVHYSHPHYCRVDEILSTINAQLSRSELATSSTWCINWNVPLHNECLNFRLLWGDWFLSLLEGKWPDFSNSHKHATYGNMMEKMDSYIVVKACCIYEVLQLYGMCVNNLLEENTTMVFTQGYNSCCMIIHSLEPRKSEVRALWCVVHYSSCVERVVLILEFWCRFVSICQVSCTQCTHQLHYFCFHFWHAIDITLPERLIEDGCFLQPCSAHSTLKVQIKSPHNFDSSINFWKMLNSFFTSGKFDTQVYSATPNSFL